MDAKQIMMEERYPSWMKDDYYNLTNQSFFGFVSNFVKDVIHFSLPPWLHCKWMQKVPCA